MKADPATKVAPLALAAMTCAELAEARGAHLQAVRVEYGRALREDGRLVLPPIKRCEKTGELTKFCLDVGGGLETESVIIPMDSYRGSRWRTLCVSTQIGCRMGCTFCETARMGWLRNLSAAEIVAQRLAARRLLHEQYGCANGPYRYDADGIRNIVLMGMGEPLDNFDEVLQALRVLTDPRGLSFPRSQITLSTVGRVDGLRALSSLIRREPEWANLRIAVSLHAADDRLRDALVPINRGMPLAELQRALSEYPLPRKGLFLIQYVLLDGVNDSLADADALAAWCRPLRCVVNLIPYNPQRDATFRAPADDQIQSFLRRLRCQGIFVKRRVTQGRDLMGACGQLGNPDQRRQSLQRKRPAERQVA